MATNPPQLTLQEAEQQQALAEGFQSGALPALNPANLFTQIVEMANPLAPIPPPYVPAIPDPNPYTNVTPNLGLSLQGMDAVVADNFVIVDAAAGPAGAFDAVNLMTGEDFSYRPTLQNIYNVTAVLIGTATHPAPFAGSQVEMDLSYFDTFGTQKVLGILIADTNGAPAGNNFPIFATPVGPIDVFTAFTTFAVTGSVLPISWYASVTTGGTGSVAYGATITQTSTGAHAIFYGIVAFGGTTPSMVYGPVTGVDDGSIWHSGLATLLPTQTPVQATGFFGPGSGVQAVQGGTGAFAMQLNVPNVTGIPTTLYLGPRVSGIADIPSGLINVPGPVPNATNAWIDQVNGGVLIPTSAPILQTFSYNEHIRIQVA